jgi:excisionase family DNA binding protein
MATKNNRRAIGPNSLSDQRLVLGVPEAGRLLGLSRNGAYEAAKRGDIPTIRIGRLLRVPVRALEEMLKAR